VDPSAWPQLGVSGVIVIILLYILKELWADNRELRKQMREDQAQMLPALTAATAAVKDALEESIRSRALAERERQ